MTPMLYITTGGTDGWLCIRFGTHNRGLWLTFDGYGPDSEMPS